MADAAEVLRRISVPDEVAVTVLIPNERGLDRALGLREHFSEVNCFISVSETHNQHNVNRSVEGLLLGLEQVIHRARADGLRVEAVMATSLGCPYEGHVPPERVRDIASRLAEAGAHEIGFGDTTGMANPVQVSECSVRASESSALRSNSRPISTTPAGQGLANVLAALESGCTSFESSFGELGGCPVPAGATGNRHRGPHLDAPRDGRDHWS